MGLISKIEDKLHSGKESDSSKLQKSSYEDSSDSSHLRHPVSSGTATSGYGNSATATGATSGYGSSTTDAAGATGAAGAMGGSSAMPGSYDDASRTSVERDGYGQATSGYAKDSRDTSAAYSSSGRTDPRDATTTGGYGTSGYGSSTRTGPRDTTSGGYGSGSRQPYDPYSSKGQTTAANTASGYPGGSTTSREDYANDPNVPRSREGGVMNPGSHASSRNPDAIPTAGGQTVGSSGDPYSTTSSGRADPYSSTTTSSRGVDPYNSPSQTSSGHPIRDAALTSGAGAAGAGAAGYGASRMGGDERSAQDPSVAYGQHNTSTNPQDVSYMNRSSGGGAMESSTVSGMGSSTQAMGTTGSSGMADNSSMPGMDPKKMGGAYEAGYRDAMEHAKAEMGMK